MCARIPSALALLAACVGSPPTHYVEHDPVLAHLRPHAPGAIATYDVSLDRWTVVTADATATIESATPAMIASPEALRHAVASEQRRADATFVITARESLSDGFATTLEEHGVRVTFVVRELGSAWIRCTGSLPLCKSVKRG